MSEEATGTFAAQIGAGVADVIGSAMTAVGEPGLPGAPQSQRACTTPESAVQHFMSVMSPDTTSSGARGCGVVPDVVAAEGAGLFVASEASIKEPVVTHERKKKTHYTPIMLAVLEKAFQENNYPSRDDREVIHARTTLCVDKIKIWFQNRRCKERRRLKSLGLCSAALRMPTVKKTDKCIATIPSTKHAPSATIYTRMPNMQWCAPSLYDTYTPPCSGAPSSGQPGPWPGPAAPGMGGMTGWGRFCVRPPQPAFSADTLLSARGNQQISGILSDVADSAPRGCSDKLTFAETRPSADKGSTLVMQCMLDNVKTEADDIGSTTVNFATQDADAPSQSSAASADDEGGRHRGTTTDVSFQSFSSSTTTLTFAEVKPEPCSTPSQMRGSVADVRGHSSVMTSQEEPTVKCTSTAPVNPAAEEEAAGRKLMPLTNAAPLMQHKSESVDRFAPSHGTMEYARQSAPLAYPCGYSAPSMFGSAGCYGQTCNPSYWYGAMPPVASPYPHGSLADYRSYDAFSNHRAEVQNNRDFTSFQWDKPYGSYRQAVSGFPGLREFTGGFEPGSSGGMSTAGSQAVDLSWLSSLSNNRSWDLPTNVYPSGTSIYGSSSANVRTYATAGLASLDGAKTDDSQSRQHLENAVKVDYFATRVSSANTGFVNPNTAGLCRSGTQGDSQVSGPYLVTAPYENDRASDIIDEYHRQMMASYCRKECNDMECNSTAASSYPSSPANGGLLMAQTSDPGQLGRDDRFGTAVYSSESDRSGQALLGPVVRNNLEVAVARDGAVSRCSSCCSGSVEQDHQVAHVSVQGGFSYDSEETDTINCLSDFENLSSEDTRNPEDDGTESATD